MWNFIIYSAILKLSPKISNMKDLIFLNYVEYEKEFTYFRCSKESQADWPILIVPSLWILVEHGLQPY